MTWACSLRETATPVPCQATQHYSSLEFDARAMPGAKLAHSPNSIPMIGAMSYTEYEIRRFTSRS